MSAIFDGNRCPQSPQVAAYAVQALSPHEAAAVESHLASCAECQQELEILRPVVDSFVHWPTNVLRPSASLRERLARRIARRFSRRPGTGGDRMARQAGT